MILTGNNIFTNERFIVQAIMVWLYHKKIEHHCNMCVSKHKYKKIFVLCKITRAIRSRTTHTLYTVHVSVPSALAREKARSAMAI